MTDTTLEIRRETPEDIAQIRKIHLEAFNYPFEANLVDELRDDGAHVLSMVADRGGRAVGHILYSPVTIEGESVSFEIVGLAPMAVYPHLQRSGIGSKLITESIEILRADGVPAIVLLGHPQYYPKFGFVPASRYDVHYDYKVPDEAFMMLELQDGALDGQGGVAKYHQAFIDAQLGRDPSE